MPNWVDEAKEAANRDAVIKNQRIEAQKTIEQQELYRKIELFHQHTEAVRLKIEQVLLVARDKGLIVSDSYGGFSEFEDGYSDDFIFKKTRHVNNYSKEDDSDHGWDCYRVWRIKWTISIPKKDYPLEIYLNLKNHGPHGLVAQITVINKLLAESTGLDGRNQPIEIYELENIIKKWVFDLFQKYPE